MHCRCQLKELETSNSPQIVLNSKCDAIYLNAWEGVNVCDDVTEALFQGIIWFGFLEDCQTMVPQGTAGIVFIEDCEAEVHNMETFANVRSISSQFYTDLLLN